MENPWFVLAFFMIVVGLPVIAGVLADIYKRQLRFREREMELIGSQTAEKAAQYASRTAELEQRVRVLEQIVTDGGMQTAAQIEALRDRPSLGERTN
ncbi:hypothetical protein [uncultured Sphingomonas sp.]|uniref:hypothetical protein n=1 Tax=uncultured Sphingomonas sp. TaxID=158754 RepID=UPI0025EEF91F|nr:hypothetical protein [uncultured Sphingomonas sp.]